MGCKQTEKSHNREEISTLPSSLVLKYFIMSFTKFQVPRVPMNHAEKGDIIFCVWNFERFFHS